MDLPPLIALARELARSERLVAFADVLPAADARVSEPALPLLLGALHLHLARGLACLLPDDAEARDVAEAVAWFRGDEHVAFMPSRGVSFESGLEPPPHLVGERFRALDVLAAGGLVCVSAAALAERLPPVEARPERIDLAEGNEPGIDRLAESLAVAGYERVERVEERGQFAVRGGIVDVYPTTGREPILWSCSGTRSRRSKRSRRTRSVRFTPSSGRRSTRLWSASSTKSRRCRTTRTSAAARPTSSRRSPTSPSSSGGRTAVREAWHDHTSEELDLAPAAELDPLPQGQPFAFEAQRPVLAARGLAEAENELAGLLRSDNRVFVAFPHRGDALRTQALLRRVEATVAEPGAELPGEAGLLFAISPARRGFVWRELRIALLPDTQVFRKRAPRGDARIGRALQSFADLRTGDYVVHEDHGVGRLLGFETKTVAGVTRDYLFVGFRGEDRLYVPHEQIGKVSRYVGADARPPALSKLGGKAWQLIKSRARESARELAGELISLYAERQRANGVAFDLSNDWFERLEAAFPYRETEDQATAIEAVKEDLESPTPMDRLVCGDVGFGKTEIAIRAAFAVALNGKQTLMLVPTTVLAQQHWNTFRERFSEFPVRVEMVSRFRRPADVKQVLADFAGGKVDVLIGTHRVLSRDVIPKSLGLVVVDEEQRFGVAQKELLRSLRLEVDVLALTATPIPRTLHMSLAGLRDISVIETPPEGRQAIRTHVGELDEELVKAALERELARGGQSFYLHNRVETIEEAALKLQELCPGLRFAVAHGQMRERELEERMMAFLSGDADVLVSTTIIESGLDIPQANTLVVERADLLGLAQLYQIRGRVGRSDVPAHAYLFYPDARELLPEARARLATLADHTELGSGFSIAMRDLEIRGAGELLGAEQSGHVAALGFELYVELLNEAVAELQGSRRVAARPIRIDARIDAFVPVAYVDSEALKIDLHRRLALTESEDELRELRVAVEDRYGPVPEPVENLFAIQEAKLKLAQAGADYLVFRGGRISVGSLVLGSDEVRSLRAEVGTAVYSAGNHEVTLRTDSFDAALVLADAILALRRAA